MKTPAARFSELLLVFLGFLNSAVTGFAQISNILVFSGTCTCTNYGVNGRAGSSFSGNYRFATDSKQWQLDYEASGKKLPVRQSATYDGHAIYTLYLNLPSSDNPGKVSDLGGVALDDTPPLFALARLPWLAAWALGIIPPPTNNVLPPWALWPVATLYTNRIVPAQESGCASKKIEFIVRASAWQALRADPKRRQSLDSSDDVKNDFIEGEMVVVACTNFSGVLAPTDASIRQIFPPERGGQLRSAFTMTTTNVQKVSGTIEKPRFVARTQVNDARAMNTDEAGLWIAMTRPLTYYASSHWPQTSEPEWRSMVLSNALAEAGAPDGVLGFHFATDVSGFMKVEEVLPNSPALKAGLRRGDVVLSIDGQATRLQGTKCITLNRRGTVAEVVFVRNGETNTVHAKRVSLSKFANQ